MSKLKLLPIKESVDQQLKHFFGKNYQQSKIPVLGISGGPDSMCLLHLFEQLFSSLVVCHINYGLRGEESDAEEQIVRAYCASKPSIKLEVFYAPKASKGNFQAWARNYRYDQFKECKKKYNADFIALAHHKDDQVETTLMNIFKGNAFVNIQPMQVWDNQVLRPLLSISKSEIISYLEHFSIPFGVDSSNMTVKYARNWLRNEFIPTLENFFPGWDNNLLDIVQQSKDVALFQKEVASYIFRETECLDRTLFDGLSENSRKQMLYQWLKVNDFAHAITKTTIENLSKSLPTLQVGKRLSLDDAHFILNDRDRYLIQKSATDTSTPKLVFDLNTLDKVVEFEGFSVQKQPENSVDFYMDCVEIRWLEGEYILRKWESGDKIRPLGMYGRQKKLSDIFQDVKLRPSEKESVWVLQHKNDIACILWPKSASIAEQQVGVISEAFKIVPSTQFIISIKR